MMKPTYWCDGHLDLAYLAVNGRDVRRDECDPALGCVTLPALRAANVRWIFGTIFTEMGFADMRTDMGLGATAAEGDRAQRYASHDDLDGAERAGLLQMECYQRLEREDELKLIRTAADIDGMSPPPRTLILMEGADPIRSPDDVAQWHARGLRMVGLSWAYGSRYAGGNHDGGPLTANGRDMIAALDAHRIIHDVSHLSDAALDALMTHASGPVVASHSNCRALLEDKQRHLRDDQIRAITALADKRGGVIGLNLYGKFLALGRRATIDDCIAHIEHIVDVAGRRDVVALGSDMDGGFSPSGLPTGLDHPTRLHALADALQARGWSEAEITGFAHGNWLRVLHESLP